LQSQGRARCEFREFRKISARDVFIAEGPSESPDPVDVEQAVEVR